MAGSIERHGTEVHFTIRENEKDEPSGNGMTLKVVYDGKSPLPDTFRDEAQAMADGKMGDDGVFHAESIAAKCPSKYQEGPGFKSTAPVSKTPVS